MEKNKFNINPSPVTPEDIKAGKNFDAFHKQYQSTRRGSIVRRLALPTLAAVAAMVLVFMIFRLPDGGTKMMAQFITPPIQGLERTYEQISFMVEEGLMIDLPSGTKINIPPNAFVDANGNPYTGAAALNYREYTDPLSIALSGIPMTYDSAGVSYTFESAGMFDMVVEGNADGETAEATQALSLANGAIVSVGMPAANQDNGFNVYELDTANKNWALRGKDSIAPVAPEVEPEPTKIATTTKPVKVEVTDAKLQQMYNTIQVIGDSIDYYKNFELVKPLRASTEGHHFTTEMKMKDYPELPLNETVSWEVAAFTAGFEPTMNSTKWDAKLVTRIKGSEYNLKLVKGDAEYNFACKPVYQGKHYPTAIKYYDDKLAANQERLAFIEQRRKELQADYDAYKKELIAKQGNGTKQILDNTEAQFQNQYDLATTQNTVYRFVAVDKMGIWNIDRVYNQPEYAKAESEFVDSKGKVLTMHRVFLFEKDVQASFEFFKMPTSETVRFLYNPNSSYTGLGVTTDGKVFLLGPSDIKKVKVDGINTIKTKELFIPKSEKELRDKLKSIA
jgi:hypothetical protein